MCNIIRVRHFNSGQFLRMAFAFSFGFVFVVSESLLLFLLCSMFDPFYFFLFLAELCSAIVMGAQKRAQEYHALNTIYFH